MKTRKATEDFGDGGDTWVLVLYIVGHSPKSRRASDNLAALCEQLGGHQDVEIVDLLQNPDLARSEDIFATPTLVRLRPKPVRKCFGDLDDIERVLSFLQS